MKRWMAFLFALGLAVSATAQGKIHNPRGHYEPRVRVIRVAPVYPLYGAGLGYGAALGYGYGYGLRPFGYYVPFWNNPRVIETTPSELSLKIDEITNDYQYQIKTTRNDKTLSGPERRQKIRDLKHQREDAIINAKRTYYKSSNDNS